MRTNTLQAILRRHPPDGPVIRAEGKADQAAALQRMAAELSALGRRTDHHPGSQYLDFQFETGRFYYHVDLWLSFHDNALDLRPRHTSQGVGIASAAQLHRLLSAVEARVEVDRQAAQKRERVQRLQERALDGQVAEIARRLRFAYRLERTETRFQLTVKVAGNMGFILDIPFDKVQERIAAIETLLTTLRGLHASGLRFRVGPVAHVGLLKEPEGEPEEA